MTPTHKVPIHYQTLSRVEALAEVDSDLATYVDCFNWFISETRSPRPPKTTLRINGKPAVVLLNRFVYLLSTTPVEDRGYLVSDPVELVTRLRSLQKIRIRNGNPFDCRLENLDGRLSNRSVITDRVVAASLRPLPETALPSGRVVEHDNDSVGVTALDLPSDDSPLPREPSVLEILAATQQPDTSKSTTVRSITLPEDDDE